MKVYINLLFQKLFPEGNFSPKYLGLFFKVARIYFSCAAVLFNKYNFYSVKILQRRNLVITFTFLKEYNVPCREMWLLQTLYNMIKVTPFLNNWHILWKFQERVTFSSVTIWRDNALLKVSTDFCHFHYIWHSVITSYIKTTASKKQSLEVFYKNTCSSEFRKIHWKTPVLELLF